MYRRIVFLAWLCLAANVLLSAYGYVHSGFRRKVESSSMLELKPIPDIPKGEGLVSNHNIFNSNGRHPLSVYFQRAKDGSPAAEFRKLHLVKTTPILLRSVLPMVPFMLPVSAGKRLFSVVTSNALSVSVGCLLAVSANTYLKSMKEKLSFENATAAVGETAKPALMRKESMLRMRESILRMLVYFRTMAAASYQALAAMKAPKVSLPQTEYRNAMQTGALKQVAKSPNTGAYFTGNVKGNAGQSSVTMGGQNDSDAGASGEVAVVAHLEEVNRTRGSRFFQLADNQVDDNGYVKDDSFLDYNYVNVEESYSGIMANDIEAEYPMIGVSTDDDGNIHVDIAMIAHLSEVNKTKQTGAIALQVSATVEADEVEMDSTDHDRDHGRNILQFEPDNEARQPSTIQNETALVARMSEAKDSNTAESVEMSESFDVGNPSMNALARMSDVNESSLSIVESGLESPDLMTEDDIRMVKVDKFRTSYDVESEVEVLGDDGQLDDMNDERVQDLLLSVDERVTYADTLPQISALARMSDQNDTSPLERQNMTLRGGSQAGAAAVSAPHNAPHAIAGRGEANEANEASNGELVVQESASQTARDILELCSERALSDIGSDDLSIDAITELVISEMPSYESIQMESIQMLHKVLQLRLNREIIDSVDEHGYLIRPKSEMFSAENEYICDIGDVEESGMPSMQMADRQSTPSEEPAIASKAIPHATVEPSEAAMGPLQAEDFTRIAFSDCKVSELEEIAAETEVEASINAEPGREIAAEPEGYANAGLQESSEGFVEEIPDMLSVQMVDPPIFEDMTALGESTAESEMSGSVTNQAAEQNVIADLVGREREPPSAHGENMENEHILETVAEDRMNNPLDDLGSEINDASQEHREEPEYLVTGGTGSMDLDEPLSAKASTPAAMIDEMTDTALYECVVPHARITIVSEDDDVPSIREALTASAQLDLPVGKDAEVFRFPTAGRIGGVPTLFEPDLPSVPITIVSEDGSASTYDPSITTFSNAYMESLVRSAEDEIETPTISADDVAANLYTLEEIESNYEDVSHPREMLQSPPQELLQSPPQELLHADVITEDSGNAGRSFALAPMRRTTPALFAQAVELHNIVNNGRHLHVDPEMIADSSGQVDFDSGNYEELLARVDSVSRELEGLQRRLREELTNAKVSDSLDAEVIVAQIRNMTTEREEIISKVLSLVQTPQLDEVAWKVDISQDESTLLPTNAESKQNADDMGPQQYIDALEVSTDMAEESAVPPAEEGIDADLPTFDELFDVSLSPSGVPGRPRDGIPDGYLTPKKDSARDSIFASAEKSEHGDVPRSPFRYIDFGDDFSQQNKTSGHIQNKTIF